MYDNVRDVVGTKSKAKNCSSTIDPENVYENQIIMYFLCSKCHLTFFLSLLYAQYF